MGNIIHKIYNKIYIDNEKNILDKALDNDIFNEFTEDTLVFGCRSPYSKGIGYWDGAFIYIQQRGQSIAIVFENNMDFISNNMSFDDALKLYSDFLKKEWIPMSNQDITNTSGII